MARRDDSNRFAVSVVMFNRTSNAIPIVAAVAIVLAFWFTRERL